MSEPHNRCANCGLVYARHHLHDHPHPDMVRASFAEHPEWATVNLYCPTVMARSAKKPTEAPTSPSKGLPEAPVVDLSEEAIDKLLRPSIETRAKANEILLVCYPSFVVWALTDDLAITVANIIAGAVDNARGAP